MNAEGEYDTSALRCLKASPPPCQVEAFIEKNREALDIFAANARKSSRPNLQRASDAFEGILNGSDVPYGERSNCYPISDTLIVLEAPEDAELYSTDGDVREICSIMERAFFAAPGPSS